MGHQHFSERMFIISSCTVLNEFTGIEEVKNTNVNDKFQNYNTLAQVGFSLKFCLVGYA